MARLTKFAVVLLAATLAAGPAWPQQPARAPAKEIQAAPPQATDAQEGDVEPKFIWGILINIAVSKLSNYAFEVFAKWAFAKLTGGTDGFSVGSVVNLMRDSGARIGLSSRGATLVAARGVDTDAAPIVVGNPDKPLVADGKKENYQGVHIALMMAEGGNFSFRPVNQGFRTGERFKLRVLSTFGGELTIENINPRGERKQVFPPRSDQVVTLLPATETLIPMDPNQFFEFGGATGREQLVINVVDARATGPAASRNKIFRQDTKYGSNFLQEVADGTYPTIQQAVELVHSAK